MPSNDAEEVHPTPSKPVIEHRMEPKALEPRWDTGSGPFPMLSKEANYAFTSTTVRGVEKFPESFIPFSHLDEGDQAMERMAKADFREDRLQFHTERQADWLDKWTTMIDNPSSRKVKGHPKDYRRVGTRDVILDGMRPHSREAFLARVNSTRQSGCKPLAFEFVGATQSICVDNIVPYEGVDTEEAIKESLNTLIPKDKELREEVDAAVRRNLVGKFVSIYAKVKEMLADDLGDHEYVRVDEYWSLGDDLEKVDDSICAFLLNNSGGYGGIRILGNGFLQELQAPRFWVAGGQRYRLVVRRWGELCETYGEPSMLLFSRKKREETKKADDEAKGANEEGEEGVDLETTAGECSCI